jgi:hypothetical protein
MNAHIVMSMTRGAEAKVGCSVTPVAFYARGMPQSQLRSRAGSGMVRSLHHEPCFPS